MKWLCTTLFGSAILFLGIVSSTQAQEQSPYTENPLVTGMSIYAFVPETLSSLYPIYYIPPNSPFVQGVPLSTEAGADTVVVRGKSYPNSKVTLLKSGVVLAEATTSRNGIFEIHLKNLNPSTYVFGVKAVDANYLSSNLETFTVYIASGVTTVIEGIIIAPTITTDKSEVLWGELLTIKGMSVPNATVNVLVNSESKLLKKVTARTDGTWFLELDTHELEIGDHTAQARSILDEGISSLSNEIMFTAGSKNTSRKSTLTGTAYRSKCDINNDSKVNLTDFSIIAYWYKRDGFPSTVDLNNNGTIDLTDFSILAFCWTG